MTRFLAVLALALAPFGLHAHPHAWIDVRSTIVLSADGMIAAIEEQWLFDELYSAAILDGLQEDSPGKTLVIGDFAAEVIENLGPYGYFMRIVADGRPIGLNTVTRFNSEMKGRQLQLSFTAPLAEAVDPRRDDVSFSVYDPTYFIQMTHRPEDPPTIRSAQGHACRARVAPPNPTPEDVARALALDRGATSEEGLGDLFAEKVHIQCG
ncbi:DUF1007 family protein [Castellaniella hirudinis]|uniref:DUF1007 family protein n=1 Tax=Castellaniella hirudinis TaxID=1144617 RepID=UPI0039C0DF7F